MFYIHLGLNIMPLPFLPFGLVLRLEFGLITSAESLKGESGGGGAFLDFAFPLLFPIPHSSALSTLINPIEGFRCGTYSALGVCGVRGVCGVLGVCFQF